MPKASAPSQAFAENYRPSAQNHRMECAQMQSQFTRIAFCISLLCVLVVLVPAQIDTSSTVTVKRLPPEAFPTGNCAESEAGFLGVVEKDGRERTKLTAEEIGNYVSKRLSEGYSVTLHPQASGRIYATADCHSAKP
jgi:hypothetical protein